MKIIGIDPGPIKTAIVIIYQIDNVLTVDKSWYVDNDNVFGILSLYYNLHFHVAIEGISALGQKISQATIKTCEYAARYYQFALDRKFHTHMLYRRKKEQYNSICSLLCGVNYTKAKNIKEKVLHYFPEHYGTPKNPGLLRMPTGADHKISAAAVALAYMRHEGVI